MPYLAPPSCRVSAVPAFIRSAVRAAVIACTCLPGTAARRRISVVTLNALRTAGVLMRVGSGDWSAANECAAW